MVLETHHPWTFINILIINYVMSATPNPEHWTCIQEIVPSTALALLVLVILYMIH